MGSLMWIFLIGLVSILPVRWAGNFAEGDRTGILFCALASFVAPGVAFWVFRMLNGGFNGFLVAYISSLVIFVLILAIPLRNIIKFAVIVLLLQIMFGMALISLNFGGA